MKHWVLFIIYFLAANFHSNDARVKERLLDNIVEIAPSKCYLSNNTKPQNSFANIILNSPFTQQEEGQDEDESEKDWNHTHYPVQINPITFFFNQSSSQHYEDTNATSNAHQLRVFSPPEFDC
jgi:hypothetical protein